MVDVMDERGRMQKEHEKKMEGIVGFIKSIDAALEQLKPKWSAEDAEISGKLQEVYAAYPAVGAALIEEGADAAAVLKAARAFLQTA